MRIIVALGGNLISDASKKGETFDDQLRKVKQTAAMLTDIVAMGHTLVVTHGNGPQVGSLLLQQNAEVEGATKLPMNLLGALTQGQIGVTLQHELINEIRGRNIEKNVYVIPTSVIVDSDDPGFANPSKPIGPFYSDEEHEIDKAKNPNYVYVKKDKGYRRMVASPTPREILEKDLIQNLVDTGNLVIAVGGGGTPVTDNGKIERRAAVIDKDLATALLAEKIDADMLIILTNVDGVYLNFGKDGQEFLSELNIADAEQLMQTDKDGMKGSMGPKLQACVNFSSKGGKSIITNSENVLDALNGKAGTLIK